VIVERDLHPPKQRSQIFSTEQGIQIDESDEQHQNASLLIHESLESDIGTQADRFLDLGLLERLGVEI
jgi:hypothetical protein